MVEIFGWYESQRCASVNDQLVYFDLDLDIAIHDIIHGQCPVISIE